MIGVGTTVRIERDEYPDLVGVTGEVTRVDPDGTTAWVALDPAHPNRGVWCSVANLSEV